MSTIYTEITLKNSIDIANTDCVKTNRVFTQSAWTMVINEATREKLGLRIFETKTGTLANGKQPNIAWLALLR